MVAKITTGNNLYGALAYNMEKVNEGQAAVIGTHNICEPADGKFTIAQTTEEFLRWMPSHFRTEKPIIHISLNPDTKDDLSDEQLSEIAGKYMQGMGWGEQPYMVFKHTDTGRTHIHIVSVQVTPDGRKIDDSYRNTRSVALTEEIEKEYGLHPAKEQGRSQGRELIPVNGNSPDLKKQIAAVVKPAATMYKFQTLGEWRALLSLYNIGIEQVEGQRAGVPYRGLIYTVTDEQGERQMHTAIKSSTIGRVVGIEELERRMKTSAKKIEKDKSRERVRQQVKQAIASSANEQALRENLHLQNIDLYLRRNPSGRITGVTFIDHSSRTVLNGSRLGKEYSANAFEELFSGMADSRRRPKAVKTQEGRSSNIERSFGKINR